MNALRISIGRNHWFQRTIILYALDMIKSNILKRHHIHQQLWVKFWWKINCIQRGKFSAVNYVFLMVIKVYSYNIFFEKHVKVLYSLRWTRSIHSRASICIFRSFQVEIFNSYKHHFHDEILHTKKFSWENFVLCQQVWIKNIEVSVRFEVTSRQKDWCSE